MPITSNQISAIINAQVASYGQQALMAHATTNYYGGEGMGGVTPPMSMEDPFQVANQVSNQAMMGGSLATGALGAAGMAVGGVQLAGAFGFAPRVLAPFENMLYAGKAAYATGGMAGAIGAGALTMAPYMAASAAMDWGMEHMKFGAENRAVGNATMGQIFPHAPMSAIGQMTGQLEGYSREGYGTMGELTSLMQQSIGTGALSTSSSMHDFQANFGKLLQQVKEVATVMNSSLTDAQQAVQQVKGMGISSGNAGSYFGALKGAAAASGVDQGTLGQYGMYGSYMANEYGSNQFKGAMGSVLQAGMLGMVEKNEMISGLSVQNSMRYTQGALGFLTSQKGMPYLGAMMDESGGIDEDFASRIASGNLTEAQATKEYERKIGGSSRMQGIFQARSGQLASSFLSEYGPQSVMAALHQSTRGSETPELLEMQLTGMNPDDISGLTALQGRGDIKQRMLAEMKDSLSMGMGRRSLGEALKLAMEKLTLPVRSRLQDLGASIAQYMDEAVEDVANQMLGEVPNYKTGMAYINKINKMQARGDRVGAARLQGLLSGEDMPTRSFGTVAPSTGFGEFARDSLPSALMLGQYPEGTRLRELPGYGFGSMGDTTAEDHYSHIAAMGLGGTFTLSPGGTSAMGNAGKFLQGVASDTLSLTPKAGWTGVGTGAGAARMGLGAGWLIGGAARLAGPLAAAWGTYNLFANDIPEMQRYLGLSDPASSLTGEEGELMRALTKSGLLRRGAGMDIQRMDRAAAAGGGDELNFAFGEVPSKVDFNSFLYDMDKADFHSGSNMSYIFGVGQYRKQPGRSLDGYAPIGGTGDGLFDATAMMDYRTPEGAKTLAMARGYLRGDMGKVIGDFGGQPSIDKTLKDIRAQYDSSDTRLAAFTSKFAGSDKDQTKHAKAIALAVQQGLLGGEGGLDSKGVVIDAAAYSKGVEEGFASITSQGDDYFTTWKDGSPVFVDPREVFGYGLGHSINGLTYSDPAPRERVVDKAKKEEYEVAKLLQGLNKQDLKKFVEENDTEGLRDFLRKSAGDDHPLSRTNKLGALAARLTTGDLARWVMAEEISAYNKATKDKKAQYGKEATILGGVGLLADRFFRGYDQDAFSGAFAKYSEGKISQEDFRGAIVDASQGVSAEEKLRLQGMFEKSGTEMGGMAGSVLGAAGTYGQAEGLAKGDRVKLAGLLGLNTAGLSKYDKEILSGKVKGMTASLEERIQELFEKKVGGGSEKDFDMFRARLINEGLAGGAAGEKFITSTYSHSGAPTASKDLTGDKIAKQMSDFLDNIIEANRRLSGVLNPK